MANGETAVGWHIPCAKTGSAEAAANGCARLGQVCQLTMPRQIQEGRLAGRIYRQAKGHAADAFALQNFGCTHQVLPCAAGTAGNHRLINIELAVFQLLCQRSRRILQLKLLHRCRIHLSQQFCSIGLELANGIGIRGMEGQRNHWLHLIQGNLDQIIIPGSLCRIHLLICFTATQHVKTVLGCLICAPDRAEAGGFRGHNINTAAVIHGQIFYTRAKELQHCIFHRAGLKHRANQIQRHVLRANAGLGLTRQIDCDHLGISDIVSPVQQLLHQFRSTFAKGNCAKGTVAGVRVAAKNHLSAAGITLPHIGMNDSLMRRNKFAAIFLCRRQAKHMVVLIDRAADSAQGVMTVGQHIGQGKFLQSRSSCGLNNANISNVMARHGVDLKLERICVARYIVAGQNTIGHGLCLAGELIRLGCRTEAALFIDDTMIGNSNH